MSKKDPNKKGLIGEFKEFITRGNVLDMAVGVIIGGAFTAIVTALTSGILQPLINYLIGLIAGDGSLEKARTILGNPVYMSVEVSPDVFEQQVDWSRTNYIDWGAFIGAIINFILVAIILFIIIKLINKAHEAGVAAKEKALKKEEAPVEEEKAE